MNKSKIHVTVFSTGERTESLALHGIKTLGFNNINLISGPSSFAEKFKVFVEHSHENIDKFDYFLRSDADEIIYDNVFNFIETAIQNKEFLFAHGFFIDAFMKKPRGGGPKLFSKKAIIKMNQNIDLIKECPKPESYYVKLMTGQKYPYFMTIYEATCLHEYLQHPSKVGNSFLNRLKRNHQHLYDITKLLSKDSLYRQSFEHAITIFKKGVNINNNSSKFIDMSMLDDIAYKRFPDTKRTIDVKDHKRLYDEFSEIFNKRKLEALK